jgi:hypothetical protein
VIQLRRSGRFWYDFVVGDNWTVAPGVVAAFAAPYLATHHGRNWFWLLPGSDRPCRRLPPSRQRER